MYLTRSPLALPRVIKYPLVQRNRAYVKPDVNESIILPKVNIFEDSENIFFEFEIAGVKKEDINIKINDEKILNLTAKKYFRNQVTENEEDRKFHEYKRSFKLEGEYHEDQISAAYIDGLLTVKLPKRIPVEKMIEIN